MDDAKILELFGKQLQATRRAKGWSQEKLAFESNLDRTYVSSVERGHRNISIINIYKLSKALGIPPHTLFILSGGWDE